MWEALGDYRGPLSMHVFVRYAVAKAIRDARELSYRTYVTDQLRLSPQMMYMTARWYDVVTGKAGATDKRTVDEIADDIVSRFGEQS